MSCYYALVKYTKLFAIVLVLLVVGSAVNSFTPYIWGKVLDAITGGRVHELIICLILHFAIAYIVLGLGYFEGYWGSKLNYAIEVEIKQKLLDKILHMPCSDLDAFDTGTLVSRINSDASVVITFVFDVLSSIITIVINIFSSLIFALRISTMLSGLSLAFIPFFCLMKLRQILTEI